MTNKFGIKSLDHYFELSHAQTTFIFSPFLWLHFFKVKPSMRQISTTFLPHTPTQISFSARFKMQQLQAVPILVNMVPLPRSLVTIIYNL